MNANIKTAPALRQAILLRKLFAFDPDATELFDNATIVESGIDGRIKQLAESVVKRVHDMNELYASSHGEDLFKPTNKTVQANARMSKPIRNLAEYKTFIEDMYFLFHEGVGRRLDGITPVSFTNVNELRTDVEHDVDHGGASKAGAKRKKLGATFQKYAGGQTPNTLAPERFRVLQANLLAEIEADLLTLKVPA